jgi:hypothetical protein
MRSSVRASFSSTQFDFLLLLLLHVLLYLTSNTRSATLLAVSGEHIHYTKQVVEPFPLIVYDGKKKKKRGAP